MGDMKTKDCSSISIPKYPAWREDRPLRHYTNQGRCMLDPEDVQNVYDKYGSPLDYCQAIDSDRLLVDAAPMKHEVGVGCKEGYATSQKHATCTYLTASKGKFVPTPECTWKEDWCAGAQISNEEYWSGVPWMAPAALGATSVVHCSFAKVPEVQEVTCSKSMRFSPTPKCVPKADFCKAVDSSEAKFGSVDMAPYGEQREVTCFATGYIAQTTHVLCDQSSNEHDGAFYPSPVCVKDPYFCPAIDADMFDFIKGKAANVDAGPLDVDQLVRCRQGFKPSSFSVRCGSDQNFHPQPSCTKIEDWCATVVSDFEDGLFVYKAGRDDMSVVRCSENYYPVDPHAWCGKGRNFEPQPKCIKKQKD